jgi:hypothetical protein
MAVEWDPTLSIGELATSLALLGAATGYVINLATTRRRERHDDRYRGTKLVILELFEAAYPNDVTDHEVWDQYTPGPRRPCAARTCSRSRSPSVSSVNATAPLTASVVAWTPRLR